MERTFKLSGIVFCLSLFLISCNQNQPSPEVSEHSSGYEFPSLKGPYLGQNPPGTIPEIFAPGIISTGLAELDICFSPDGKEFYFSIFTIAAGPFRKNLIFGSYIENSVWMMPSEFTQNSKRRTRYPFICPQGNKLFYNSSQTELKEPNSSPSFIWYVERIEGKWENPMEVDFGPDYKGSAGIYPTVAANGNLYFTGFEEDGPACIYRSTFVDGKYSTPERLSEAVNKGGGDHAYIAQDESYLIFASDREDDALRGNDLYISFQDSEGKWTEAQNLGETINCATNDTRPFVSFDGKYLFFASDRTMISELPKKIMSYQEVQDLLTGSSNGMQHLYWVDAKIIESLRPLK